jgi:hypothetical protein
LTCPDIKSLGCHPSTSSSNSSLNFFSNLTPHPSLPSPNSTPSSVGPSLKTTPSTTNCLQFLQPHPSRVVSTNKDCSHGSQVRSRPSSPLCFQSKIEDLFAKTSPLPQPSEYVVKPSGKLYSSQNQPSSKPCTRISPPKPSSLDCGSLIPSCFNYSTPQTPQTPLNSPCTCLQNSSFLIAKSTTTPINLHCGMDFPPPLVHKSPCPLSAKPNPLSSCKPPQTFLPSSYRSQTPPSSNYSFGELFDISTSIPPQKSVCQESTTSSSCEERTKRFHCSETAKPIDPPHPFPCTKKTAPLPLPSKTLVHLQQASKFYSCEHTKNTPVIQSDSNSRNTIPSSTLSCFNFSVPKSLTTCPECLMYCVDSPHGYSQTIKATSWENQSSFMCLPFGRCASNLRHSINHSSTQTS